MSDSLTKSGLVVKSKGELSYVPIIARSIAPYPQHLLISVNPAKVDLLKGMLTPEELERFHILADENEL